MGKTRLKQDDDAPASKRQKKEVTSLADLSEEDDEDFSGSESDDNVDEGSDSGADEEHNENDGKPGHGAPTRAQLNAQEIQVARETSELFKSNIFKMQIDELLGELKLEDKRTAVLDRTLFKLHGILQEVEPVVGLDLARAEKQFANGSITIPFPDPRPARDVKYTFGFESPASINVVGSYNMKTAVKQPEGTGVDLLVEMPRSLFQEKDYLNYRYFHKRAFYVACVARHLSKHKDLALQVNFSYPAGDQLRPILRLTFEEKKMSKFYINILFGVDSGVFPLRKLGPDRNSVRHADEESKAAPTPRYNASVLADVMYTPALALLKTCASECEGFLDACKLGRLWLRQRGITASSDCGGFGHFEWAMLMAALLQGGGESGSKVLMQGYSSYQMFKGTVSFLAKHDWSKEGISFSVNRAHSSKPDKSAAGMLYDPELRFNVFWKVPQWSLQLVSYEAKIATDLLTDVVVDRFETIFMKNVTNPYLRYDMYFEVSMPDDSPSSTRDSLKYASALGAAQEKCYRVLRRALEKRVRLVSFHVVSGPTVFPLNRRRDRRKLSQFTVGLVLDADHAEELVTFGPTAEETQASEQFQAFWGPKSDLRRFQDGTIREAVVWSHSARKPVVRSIVEYILSRHMRGFAIQFDKRIDNVLARLRLQIKVTGHESRSVTSQQLFQLKYSAFQQLSTKLQELKTLPLRIKSLLAASPSLRNSSMDEPCPYDFGGDDSVATCVVEFETSNRWPDDAAAAELTKAAFLLQVANELESLGENEKYVTKVGMDPLTGNVTEPIETPFLLVQTPQGFTFKLRVATDRDEILLSRILPQHKEDDINSYKQVYRFSTAHSRLVRTLCLRFVFLSPTIRLLKEWFHCQLLGSYITPELIELLAMKPFLDSAPYEPPSSPTTAFFRVLEFIAGWDWRSDPLILDVEKAQDESREDKRMHLLSKVEGVTMGLALHQSLNAEFSKLRQNDPAFTHAPIFVGTRVDPTGVAWSQTLPRSDTGRVIAVRMTALARSAFRLVSQQAVDAKLIFTPSLEDYDFVIRLASTPTDADSEFKNLALPVHSEALAQKSVSLTDELYKDLRRAYADALLLFYMKDTTAKQSRDIITGLWRQDVVQRRRFKVNTGYSIIPVAEDAVEINKDAILHEIQRIGGDLIRDINVRRV